MGITECRLQLFGDSFRVWPIVEDGQGECDDAHDSYDRELSHSRLTVAKLRNDHQTTSKTV